MRVLVGLNLSSVERVWRGKCDVCVVTCVCDVFVSAVWRKILVLCWNNGAPTISRKCRAAFLKSCLPKFCFSSFACVWQIYLSEVSVCWRKRNLMCWNAASFFTEFMYWENSVFNVFKHCQDKGDINVSYV